mmetsp:Transcript_28892/g.97420  ORF Transcript_28892/g.97420 Transcript_28892/m.97420 type:complete len:237 (-) Transcript_28892:3057-3767(-)
MRLLCASSSSARASFSEQASSLARRSAATSLSRKRRSRCNALTLSVGAASPAHAAFVAPRSWAACSCSVNSSTLRRAAESCCVSCILADSVGPLRKRSFSRFDLCSALCSVVARSSSSRSLPLLALADSLRRRALSSKSRAFFSLARASAKSTSFFTSFFSRPSQRRCNFVDSSCVEASSSAASLSVRPEPFSARPAPGMGPATGVALRGPCPALLARRCVAPASTASDLRASFCA